ncbi:methyltransferase domain-containing protein [Paractinoplanes durhamensis]|uniref:Protein-L-isoaspartate O-methyltransferase n=2 Tax=Paractinoplanes durhamensis TaxID=113563 RepID=A0ABQ3Z2S2_9ACTN|nr:methyltransferase domain-containing protein [Actinoplanes durhamensis]GIE04123.1 protein-L-isoaspartate O-methyltransferase [Actinoplanes durhamensis]
MIVWQPYAAALVTELAHAGVLAPGWRPPFEQVPRHVFVPEFFTDDDERVSADDAAQHDRWLASVYSDTSLTTQLMTAPGTDLTWPTSSSTRPSLMARMLGLLDVAGGHRVLEIGTGTGYNVALLSHRLGDTDVTSIDIDPALVETARERLAGLGYRPRLSAGDGAEGVVEHAPYDRIIATCGVPEIPLAWITQLTTGGLIVADVRGELGSSLVVARKSTPHSVAGRFLTSSGHFMWMRAKADNPLRNGGGFGAVYDFTEPKTGTTNIPLAAFDDEDFRFALQLAVPGLGAVGHAIRDGGEGIFLVTEDDTSWAEISPDTGNGSTVLYGGPRLLWPDVADTWHWWNGRGRPERSRFGLTAYDDGRQLIWLDREDQPIPRH